VEGDDGFDQLLASVREELLVCVSVIMFYALQGIDCGLIVELELGSLDRVGGGVLIS